MKKFAFFLALFLSLITHSFAESYEETYARFAEVARLSEAFDSIINEQYLMQSLEQQATIMGAGFSKSIKAKLVGAIKEVFQNAKPEYDKYIFELYKKHYTQDDLIELIAFYSTPVGKKTIKLQDELTLQGTLESEKIIAKYRPIMIEKIREILESSE